RNRHFFFEAMKEGNIESLKWLEENSLPPDYNREKLKKDCFAALKENVPNVLNWIKTGLGVQFDESSQAHAANATNLDAMKWLLEHAHIPPTLGSAICAIEEGSLDCVQWALENGAPWDDKLIEVADDHNRHDLHDWLINYRDQMGLDNLFREV